MEMTELNKRWKINEICTSIPQDDEFQCLCPYNDDPNCWCRTGRVADIPGDKLDEVLQTLESVHHEEKT